MGHTIQETTVTVFIGARCARPTLVVKTENCLYIYIYIYLYISEAASPVRLVRPRPDHFSAGCWTEDETIGPGVPRKLVFALHVRVSRNRSRSFISPPRASRNASGASLRLPRVLHFRASPPQPCTCTSDLLFAMV